MTICGCCSRELARRFLPKLDCRLKRNRFKTWLTGSWRWRRARAAIYWQPIVRDRKGEYRKDSPSCANKAFKRVKVDGEFYDLDEPPALDKKFRHDIDVVVDRIVLREGIETRLADSFRTALDLADGITILETAPSEGAPERYTFSEKFACPVSGFTIPEIEPRLFPLMRPLVPVRNATGWGLNCSLMSGSWCPIKP